MAAERPDPVTRSESPEPIDQLITGGLVVTLDGTGRGFADGAVAVREPWIAAG